MDSNWKSSISRVTKKFLILGVKKIFKKFNFLINFLKRVQFFETNFWKSGSFLCVKFFWRGFNSLRQILRKKKGSIPLCHSFSEKKLNSLGRCWEKKGSILWVTFQKKVQFCESCSKKGSTLWSHTRKKVQILWVVC